MTVHIITNLVGDDSFSSKRGVIDTKASSVSINETPNSMKKDSKIVLPAGMAIQIISPYYIPEHVRDDTALHKMESIDQGDEYVVVYYRNKFLRVSKKHIYIPKTLGWGPNL